MQQEMQYIHLEIFRVMNRQLNQGPIISPWQQVHHVNHHVSEVCNEGYFVGWNNSGIETK